MEPQRGDEAELFASFNDELLRTVRRDVAGSAANIEDAVAIAWAIFLRRQPDRDQNWRGWLYRVATREAIRLERAQRESYSLDGDDRDPSRQIDPAAPGGDPVARRMELRDALTSLATVTPRRREAARLRTMGFKYTEIAELMGLSYTRVNRLLTEANVQMREEDNRRRAEQSSNPRVNRLAQLEREPPTWLQQAIGRPPSSNQSPRVLLAWRRAAIAIDDYRSSLVRSPRPEPLGERPSRPEDARRYDYATVLIERVRRARAQERGRGRE